MTEIESLVNFYFEKGVFDVQLRFSLLDLNDRYQKILFQSSESKTNQRLLKKLIELIAENITHPPEFSIFHKNLRAPFDYYQFGLDFMRPFIDFQNSKLLGLENIHTIQEQLKQGDNVILLANHQIEPDPQIISLFLENIAPVLATDMVIVAGHRVISDPMAIPMSLGRNLLCIYSKKHISYPPEEKAQKMSHNQRTLKKMQDLLNEGGYCIYVAPSGGRDRPNVQGALEVAPFDSQSIEMFRLMGRQSSHVTHFYPLALNTYHLMPPPKQVEKELGEKRMINISPVHLAFGEEIDINDPSFFKEADKKIERVKRSEFIWNKVRNLYASFDT